MEFSHSSDVTVVITSCGRFDLLEKTIASFDENNTYAINKVIITEDSGKDEVSQHIPSHWKEHCEIIVNHENLGQIKSIDLAYGLVTTEYVFHCEDDWCFYRKGFIEDSKKLLVSNDKILQVWLRDFAKDIQKHYPFHTLSGKETDEGIEYFKLLSSHQDWRGFSFNPGLKRMSDYNSVKSYCQEGLHSSVIESNLSKLYEKMGFFVVILAQSAVEHIGWDNHIVTNEEIVAKSSARKKKLKHIAIGFVLGSLFTYIVMNTLH